MKNWPGSYLTIFILTLLLTQRVDAQNAEKKALTTNDFAHWKTIKNQSVSDDGQLVLFEVNPLKGDGTLVLKSNTTGQTDSIARGYDARISPMADFIVFKIKNPAETIRVAKKKKQELRDSLGILIPSSHKVYTFPDLKNFSLPKENARWVAFMSDRKKPDDKVIKTNDQEGKDIPDDKNSRLALFHIATGDTICFQHVTEYIYAPNGRNITFIRQTKDSLERTEVVVFDTRTRKTNTIFKQVGTSKKIVTDDRGEQFGFLFSADTIKEKVYSLFYGSENRLPKAVVIPGAKALPYDWAPSEFADLSFSENGKYLFFGTRQQPHKALHDTLPADDKPVLDIWSWQDKELQPGQKVNGAKEKNRTYKAVYLTQYDKYVQLADSTVREIRTIQKGNGRFAHGVDYKPYELESSWTGKSNADHYLVNVETGEKRLMVQKKSTAYLSPGGKYIVWYDPADSTYSALPTGTGSAETIRLSANIPATLCDERCDTPGNPNPYGISGWSADDKYLFINDRYDIWRVELAGTKSPVNATNEYGRKNQIRLQYLKLDPEEEFIESDRPVILKAFYEESKSEGFFSAGLYQVANPQVLLTENKKFLNVIKAKKADALIYTREDVKESPDLWSDDLKFTHPQQLSNANPDQHMFKWPTVRLVNWKTFSGKETEGLLYLPENIDTTHKYPMIVYIYERNADNLHSYTTPAPTRSTVNRTYFTSNDYIVFIPDITYEAGYPGKSAFDAVVSGTQFVRQKYPFIDGEHIGIQGQSWGGYQAAWLITQTNLFKAAMAGAPVSNMTSAYGGIRWASGASRMFQYEQDQSRIGGTLWDKHLQFIENSPIFYVPKIETPLLIMHNDNDGAVPWYQGIELFTAMRRLSKPVWMLTYNNEEHNLKAESWANRMDLTIRMQQFFDHYLKGSPMPDWMKNGLPFIKKGTLSAY